MFEISAKEIRKQSLLPYLENHYTQLNKKQIYDITTAYIYASYMHNGNKHVDFTNDAIRKLENKGALKCIEK